MKSFEFYKQKIIDSGATCINFTLDYYNQILQLSQSQHLIIDDNFNINCQNCDNCYVCFNCVNCKLCYNCSNCYNCYECEKSSNCLNCRFSTNISNCRDCDTIQNVINGINLAGVYTCDLCKCFHTLYTKCNKII